MPNILSEFSDKYFFPLSNRELAVFFKKAIESSKRPQLLWLTTKSNPNVNSNFFIQFPFFYKIYNFILVNFILKKQYLYGFLFKILITRVDCAIENIKKEAFF